MTNIRRYIERAARAGDLKHETQVIASAEEARAVGRDIAAEIAGLSPEERLIVLSDLHELNQALEQRLPRLHQELAEVREQLHLVQRGVRACNRYAQGAGLSRAAKRRGS